MAAHNILRVLNTDDSEAIMPDRLGDVDYLDKTALHLKYFENVSQVEALEYPPYSYRVNSQCIDPLANLIDLNLSLMYFSVVRTGLFSIVDSIRGRHTRLPFIIAKLKIYPEMHLSSQTQNDQPEAIEPMISIILIQAMIQKARIYPEFEYLPQKYQIDHFHNPYMAKLNIKITPRHTTSASPYYFINPISGLNNIYLSHSLPLYKTQKFRFALIWRQYMTTKFARSHIGASLQHKILENYKIKAQIMTGTTSILNAQLTKNFKNNYQIFLGCSGFFQTNHFYSSVSCGLRKGMYSLLLTHKMGDETQFKLGGSRQLYDGINGGFFINGNVLEPDRAEVDLNLNQQIDNKTSTSLSIGFNPFYREVAFKVNVERILSKSQKLLVCGEYSDRGSILYLGFKNLNFNFVFPFFATDSPIPLIIGAIGFGLAYLYRKKKPKQNHPIDINSDIQKTELQRHQELKLISDKATQNYQKQKLHPLGLLIEQAYIGPQEEIAAFMNNPDRFRLLLRNQQYKNKFVDVTVSLRFYVCKNELKLRKGDKSRLLGFYRKQNSQNLIGVRYSREGNTQTKFFHINDPITIKKQE